MFDVNHTDYHNANKRSIALNRIVGKVNVPLNEVQKKMVSLRSYYGQLKGKMQASKASGAGADNVFVPQWKYFSDLDTFLCDHLVPKQTLSNITNTDCDEGQSFSQKMPKSRKKRAEPEISFTDQVMIKAMNRLDKNTDAATNQETANEDDIFGSMIACSLKKIPDGFSKEKLKISLLQTVFEARFSGHYSTNGRGESTSNTS